MKGKVLFIIGIALVILNQSCNTTTKQSEEQVQSKAQSANDSLFKVNEGGYDFAIYLPKDLMIENTPEITFNGATGDLHIRIGEQFWIVASQEKKDIALVKAEIEEALVKAEIEENMLFTSRIIEENGTSVLYQRLLPDGSAYDYSYRNISSINGKPYFFKTSEEGEYSRESVDLMKTAINSVHTRV